MKKLLRKKLSTAIVSVMLLSMLMPVLSYAASYMEFYYNAERGTLSGGIYTADPDNVTVERIDASGNIEEIFVEESSVTTAVYDDNNVAYKYKYFKTNVGSDTIKEIRVTEGVDNKVYILPKDETGNYFSNGGESVTFDVYRMKGIEHFSGKRENSFLKSGDKLVSFTPEESGHKFIELELPHGESQTATFNASTTVARDFKLISRSVNQSVYESVYASEVHASSYYSYENEEVVYSNNSFVLKFEEELLKGYNYELVLSDNSDGNEIQLPKAGYNYNANLKYGDFESYIPWGSGSEHFYFSSNNVVKFKNITFSSESTTPPNNSGSLPPIEPKKETQVVSADSLKNGKDGIVTVAISKDKPQVLLPIKASEALGNNKLQLQGEGLTVEIPTKVLAKLQSTLSAAQLEGAQISFGFKSVSVSDSTYLLNKAATLSNADVKAAGEIYDFSLSVVTKDGKVTEVSQFDEPITISLKVAATSNKSLIGVYYIADNGKLEYVGGKLVGDTIKADVSHFSKYAVLEFNKSFSDVAADYWAVDIIKEMAAKHIIQGVSEDLFAPKADVTRAEFAALLARALGLKATGPSTFADVKADAWYAEAVAAVSQAGIVKGKDATTFAPNAKITREEMSALLVRAYEYKSGSKLDAAVEAKFTDRSKAADWALASIDAAYKAGFIQGRTDDEFAPKAQLTRAESAKAIYTILVK